MRQVRKLLLVPALGAVALAPTLAHAQLLDAEPPLPNVMLLLDTSGSMEHMIDGTTPEAGGIPTTCNPGTATTKNRWATLVEILTGTIDNFSCDAVDRSSAAFLNEYTFDGAQPYDYKYYLPFHRILSNGCTAGPGTPALNNVVDWYSWPANALKYHPFNNPAGNCGAPGFLQGDDGILDVFKDRVNFGVMTFDTFPDAGTGVSGALLPVGSTGMQGLFSYYLTRDSAGNPTAASWAGGGGVPAKGQLAMCSLLDQEVGARNPGAPPWEGRLMPLASWDAQLTDVQLSNQHIQEAIIAMRPYGATPLAGQLQDAADYLLRDQTINPGNSKDFGPINDPFDVPTGAHPDGCRDTYIIVLSDGEPNMDMRGQCAPAVYDGTAPGGGPGNPKCGNASGPDNYCCPYQQPWEIAHDLALPGNPADPISPLTGPKQVKTFVIGFGLSVVNGVPCDTLTPADWAPAGQCTGAVGPLAACCTLARVAYEGGTHHAYFADDPASLQSALSTILGQIAAGSTSRTFPVFASATAAQAANATTNAPAASYQFLSSFETPAPSPLNASIGLWEGNLERKRYKCDTVAGVLQAVLQDVDPNVGDNFTQNLNSGVGPSRQFYTVIADNLVDPPDNGDDDDLDKDDKKHTIHSEFSIRPNLATDDGLGLYSGTVASGNAAAVATQVSGTPDSMNMIPKPAACNGPSLGNAATSALCAERVMRWALGESNGPTLPTRDGHELGAIYHSTPAILGPPRAFLRDESYEGFALNQRLRPLALMAGTTDGQLHAFKVAPGNPADVEHVDSKRNNELWSFLPPYVLPGLLSMYPRTQQFLLDGPVVVQDVVYERTQAQAIAGGGVGAAVWKTVLVGGGGKGGGYYYALDVTDPVNPVFLWQLSTDIKGRPLFGVQSGAPAITTVGIVENNQLSEIAVAVLPGGYTSPPKPNQTRNRWNQNAAWVDPAYTIRTKVRDWKKTAARSLTIVRLDNGKIIRSWRGDEKDGPSSIMPNKAPAPPAGAITTKEIFDSPMSGIPVPYPGRPGEVANRVYIGDADGTLWRIDLSSGNPANWDAKIAWDAYSLNTDALGSSQPVQTSPVISVDELGNLVVLYSTGDQEQLGSSVGVNNRVWSILERPAAGGFDTRANWYIPFVNGKRVTGPISLFEKTAYFATFAPSVANGLPTCDGGNGSVWGVDYKQADASKYPLPGYLDVVGPPPVYIHEKTQAVGVVVFGVAVTQTPSCFNTASFPDPFFGQYTAVSDSSQGQFQLVFQTGKGGAAQNQAVTKSTTVPLKPPKVSLRIDSWAAIVE